MFQLSSAMEVFCQSSEHPWLKGFGRPASNVSVFFGIAALMHEYNKMGAFMRSLPNNNTKILCTATLTVKVTQPEGYIYFYKARW